VDETFVHDRPWGLVVGGLIMKDRHVAERELGRVAPWARALTLALGSLAWAVAGVDTANAQTTGASDHPSAFLAAPADGVDFYRKNVYSAAANLSTDLIRESEAEPPSR
jgi:hypothetical protein